MLLDCGVDNQDTVMWYVTPYSWVDGHKCFEGKLIVCCVITRLYGVTPQTELPPSFQVYEIYSKVLKQFFDIRCLLLP
jgi:hypothetical protein